jgi:sirohydrochlorin cobaltochelatase
VRALDDADHGKGDIPSAMAREQERHPGLTYRYGRALGPHPLLTDVLEHRIDTVLDRAGRAGTHVALIGRGSTDPDANAEIAKVARLVWEGRGYAGVEPAVISLAEPSVPAVQERIRRLGAERIVVAQAEAFARDHARLDVRVAGLIGDCDPPADLVLQRYAEALDGDIRMNCDTCAYRIALRGFTHKVGQPQRPRDHPDDQVPHDHPHPHPSP